jgi:dTDP-4-dehydrorhamnose reductase
VRISPQTRVLVTGASGSLGWAVSSALAARCKVTGTYLSHARVPDGVRGLRLDLAQDLTSIAAAVASAGPDVMVHAAAITDPDRCEQDVKAAFKVNFEATHEIALAASRQGSRLVYVSTDLVFDGRRGNYSENDQPRPLSVYGTSKLRGEEGALAACPGALVARSTLIYGFGSPSSKTFLARLLEVLGEGRRMQLFTDQMRNPVLLEDLAEAIVRALEKDLSGIYHVGGSESASRYDFGRVACRVFGYDEDLLVPVTMEDSVFPARRPQDATLDITKLVGATGFKPSGLLDGLTRARSGRPPTQSPIR